MSRLITINSYGRCRNNPTDRWEYCRIISVKEHGSCVAIPVVGKVPTTFKSFKIWEEVSFPVSHAPYESIPEYMLQGEVSALDGQNTQRFEISRASRPDFILLKNNLQLKMTPQDMYVNFVWHSPGGGTFVFGKPYAFRFANELPGALT